MSHISSLRCSSLSASYKSLPRLQCVSPGPKSPCLLILRYWLDPPTHSLSLETQPSYLVASCALFLSALAGPAHLRLQKHTTQANRCSSLQGRLEDRPGWPADFRGRPCCSSRSDLVRRSWFVVALGWTRWQGHGCTSFDNAEARFGQPQGWMVGSGAPRRHHPSLLSHRGSHWSIVIFQCT